MGLSPDPGIARRQRRLAKLAQEWCERVWPADWGWQWIWSVHLTTAQVVVCTRVILNAVNANSGLKVQITPEDGDSMARVAQGCR